MENNRMTDREMQLCFCDRTVLSEVNTDYSLPDYKPEIRRLLRVDAKVIPPSGYVGSEKTELSGQVSYHLLYAGQDESLYSLWISEPYAVSVPLERAIVGEPVIMADVTPELLVSRVTAPRRLSLRLRMACRAKVYGKTALQEQIVAEGGFGDIKRREGELMAARFASCGSERFSVSEQIPLEKEDTRVLFSEAEMVVTDTAVGDGYAECRGEVLLKLLLQVEGEMPFAVRKKLPFFETVASEELRAGMDPYVCAVCGELHAEPEEGRILCDVEGVLSLRAQENRPVAYTEDLFSTKKKSDMTYRTVEYPYSLGTHRGNFTQSLYEPLEAYGIESDMTVVDLFSRVTAEPAVFEEGKWVLGGENHVTLLLFGGEEYAAKEITVPFRYEFDGENGDGAAVTADIGMLSGRARIDGGRLGLECEMKVSTFAHGKKRVTVPETVTFSEPCEAYDECVICFPRPEETLWDVAKRYHVAPEYLDEKNGDKDGKHTFLIINE